jgi:DNA-directed RNA polymerase II subunit RPB3
VQKGIQTLQQKLAAVIQELRGDDNMDGVDFGGAQSPQMNGAGFGAPDAGYSTPYGGGGSVWGNGAAAMGSTTPFGATPYGGPGNW